MSNNYTEMLAKVMDISTEEVAHLCVCITTLDMIYALSFIEEEDDDYVGVYYTTSDGKEKFVILNKEQIMSIEVVYEQDIKEALEYEEEDDSMFQ